jgi:CubicO group peptidase (beta-lactamase class C family)
VIGWKRSRRFAVNMKTIKMITLGLIIVLITQIAPQPNPHEVRLTYRYKKPQEFDDGWQTGDLCEVKIDQKKIESLVNKITMNEYPNLHSLLIVRKGKLVLEEYFSGYDHLTIHSTASCTKSFTSCLVGIALHQRIIGSIDQTLWDYFADYPGADWKSDPRRKEINLCQLLTMTSGMFWDEGTYPYSDPRNTNTKMVLDSDPVKYLLQLPIVDHPGEKFLYSSAHGVLLGAIIKKMSGLYADEFANEYLFQPLGIDKFFWRRLSDDTVQCSGGLRLIPRDMAKFGQLYLNNGKWNNKQVIPVEWVRESWKVRSYPEIEGAEGYGYQWWIDDYEYRGRPCRSYSARGYGGQFIYVFPELNTVIVMTAGHFKGKYEHFYRIIDSEILPAVLIEH